MEDAYFERNNFTDGSMIVDGVLASVFVMKRINFIGNYFQGVFLDLTMASAIITARLGEFSGILIDSNIIVNASIFSSSGEIIDTIYSYL